MRLRSLSVVLLSTAVLGAGLLAIPAAQGQVRRDDPTIPYSPGRHTAANASGKSNAWVVSLGDSFISGEAGRWAGNETGGTGLVDALGPTAYWDTPSGEAIKGCHRSQSAVIHIGVVNSLNLACSGAKTASELRSNGDWKPGIDFVNEGDREGQAFMLEKFARDHRVRMVALSIGGNDLKFSPLMEACVKAFLLRGDHCKEDPQVQAFVSPEARANVAASITGAILNVATAMERAGYSDHEWTLVLQLYPRPLPPADEFRYGDGILGNRQLIGGCGFYDADATWALRDVLPALNATVLGAGREAVSERPSLQVSYLDTTGAFDKRELCQEKVGRVGSHSGADSWTSPDAADRSEWVEDINIIKTDARDGQESLHPNYWGQLALRNCWREVWNDGDVRGGVCERRQGLNGRGEPRMDLVGGGPYYQLN
ncbi:MAG: hypothetical protein ACR2KE_09470 [Candidatus Nanopelagicales bacterium]